MKKIILIGIEQKIGGKKKSVEVIYTESQVIKVEVPDNLKFDEEKIAKLAFDKFDYKYQNGNLIYNYVAESD